MSPAWPVLKNPSSARNTCWAAPIFQDEQKCMFPQVSQTALQLREDGQGVLQRLQMAIQLGGNRAPEICPWGTLAFSTVIVMIARLGPYDLTVVRFGSCVLSKSSRVFLVVYIVGRAEKASEHNKCCSPVFGSLGSVTRQQLDSGCAVSTDKAIDRAPKSQDYAFVSCTDEGQPLSFREKPDHRRGIL